MAQRGQRWCKMKRFIFIIFIFMFLTINAFGAVRYVNGLAHNMLAPKGHMKSEVMQLEVVRSLLHGLH